MKLKQILALSAVAVSFAAFAAGETSTTVESSNEFGLLKIVTSSQRVILGVPWCACSATADQEIPVTDFVSTIGLDSGDTLSEFKSDGRSFRTWWVSDDHKWIGGPGLLAGGEEEDAKDTTTIGDETLPRGHGLILIRYKNADSPIYLHGQVGKSSSVDGGETIAGSTGNPAYTFISYPGDKAWNPNVDVSWGGQAGDFLGDQLIGLNTSGGQFLLQWVGTEAQFNAFGYKNDSKWDGDGWYYLETKKKTIIVAGRERTTTSTSFIKYVGSVPAGTGFWYVSNGASRTFNWLNLVK